jgi:hypothetical protein
MGKRSKGLNAVHQNNMLKKSMLASCKKYAEQLEQENYALKNDPNTVIGQFIGQFRELYGQNSRLSVLAASLIKKLGDSVVMTKEDMEQFQQKRINIKWEIADGETVETAKEFTFTYELQDAPPQGQPVQQTEQPGEVPECTDPDCSLPKDLKHTHTAAPVTEEATETVTFPDGTEVEAIPVVEDAEEVPTE